MEAPARPLLRQVLPAVARSFALSLRVLPGPLQEPLGITYLLARAADTIADTRALPASERARHLERLRAAIQEGADPWLEDVAARVAPGHPEAERQLLARLPDLLRAYRALPPPDRRRSRTVLLTLTQAMREALARFPAEPDGRVSALETRGDLDRYTYMNAGCVGEFWTEMVMAHRPRCARWNAALMGARGARFGQGLQLTNVLRDLPRDLRLGRCYLPRAELAQLGLEPEDLLEPKTLPRLRPLLATLVQQAVSHLREGLAYTLAVPRREVRLRLACAWPLLIGLATLRRLARAEDLLSPEVVVKVPRDELRRLLALSVGLVASNRALGAYARRLAAAVPAPI